MSRLAKKSKAAQPVAQGSASLFSAPTLPPDASPDARRLARAEQALREIEGLADEAIHEYGITQETPEKWVDYTNLVLRIMAPIRDKARGGISR